MTVPPPESREQWGTGLPGIPSMWDTPASEPVAPHVWSAPSPSSASLPRLGSRPLARRSTWVGIGLLVLVAGGATSLSAERVTVGEQAPSVVYERALPAGPPPDAAAPPPGPGAPPPVQLPGGQLLPAPQSVGEPAGGAVARRTDGGEPFGMPLGSTVALTDDTAGSRMDVTALSALHADGRLLVEVAMRTPASTGMTVVPALLLRFADGRELRHRGLTDGQDVPPVLGQGLSWQGTLVFDAPPGLAALVLDDGRALAGWSIPAG